MKNRPTRLSAITLMLALGLSSAGISAQPPENRGKPDSQPGKHAQHAGKEHRGDKDRDRYERDDERYYERDERYESRDRRDIDIEETVIREIFRDQRSYIEPARSLPPGIQKNLARGKPLPPGIAKQFDSRVQSRLPSYPGYDWRQVGTDAVLVDATTGIVETIIANVLR